MTPLKSPPTKLGRQARLFGMLARAAAIISVLAILSQLALVASPLWKSGPIAETLIAAGAQFLLSVPVLFYVAGLVRARRVFRRIGDGEIFTQANAEGLASIGWCLLIGSMWAMAAAGLEPVPAEQTLNYSLHAVNEAAAQLSLAALGLALVMIGKVMHAAANVKAENDGFF